MNERPLHLRAARRTDLEGIVALDAIRAGRPKPDYWARILRAFSAGGGREGRVALVAVNDERRVMGFVFGEVRAWEFGSERCGWIFAIAVHPACERRGLATRLCAEVTRRFAREGVTLVRTMVRRNHIPLLSLFRSLGFVAGPFSELERRVEAPPEAVPVAGAGAHRERSA